MKIVIVTYHYPPERSGGVARAVLLEKFLVGRGHQVVIAAPQNRTEGEAGGRVVPVRPWYYGLGVAVKKEAAYAGDGSPPSLNLTAKLKRRALLLANKAARAVIAPDPLLFWAIKAARKVISLNKSWKTDLVITTSPPESLNIAGLLISSRLCIPWLADFRDGWMCEPLRPEAKWPVRKNLEEFLEGLVFAKASVVSFASKLTMEDAALRRRELTGKFRYFPVGYEPFTGKPKEPDPSRFVMVYAGKLSISHGPRGGAAFFEALRNLIGENRELKDSVKIKFFGSYSEAERALVQDLVKAGVMEMNGEIPFNEILRELASASALLAISAPGFKTPVPRKLFDYLSVKRPILAICSGGEAARILEETQSGFYVEPDDVNAIKEGFSRMWRLWNENRLDAEFPCGGNQKYLADDTAVEFFSGSGLGI